MNTTKLSKMSLSQLETLKKEVEKQILIKECSQVEINEKSEDLIKVGWVNVRRRQGIWYCMDSKIMIGSSIHKNTAVDLAKKYVCRMKASAFGFDNSHLV